MKNNKRWMMWLPYLLVAMCIYSLLAMTSTNNNKALSYDQFMEVIATKDVVAAEVSVDTTVVDISGTYVDGNQSYTFTARIPNTDVQINELMDVLEEEVGNGQLKVINPHATNYLVTIISNVLPLVLFAGFAFFMFSRMGANSNNKAFEFSKSRARLEGNIKVRFKDVAGCDEEKEELDKILEELV